MLTNFENLSVNWYNVQLLGDILLDRSNVAVMMRYVSSKENLIILMTLLKVGTGDMVVAVSFGQGLLWSDESYSTIFL